MLTEKVTSMEEKQNKILEIQAQQEKPIERTAAELTVKSEAVTAKKTANATSNFLFCLKIIFRCAT